jgi:hypothetical protein
VCFCWTEMCWQKLGSGSSYVSVCLTYKFYFKFSNIYGQESNMSFIFHVYRFPSERCRLCSLFVCCILLVGVLTFIYTLIRDLLNFTAYNLVLWIFRPPLQGKSKLSGQNLSPFHFFHHRSYVEWLWLQTSPHGVWSEINRMSHT